MNIPIHGGGIYDLTADSIRALQLRFPMAHVENELLKAVYWLEKNPASRPKKPLRFIENWLAKASPKAPVVDMKRARWWSSEEATKAMAERIGCPARPGESWADFRARIADHLSERKSA